MDLQSQSPYPTDQQFPLANLINTVTSVINNYQARVLADNEKPLILKKAVFEFNTVVSKSGGISISVLFLKIGGKLASKSTQDFKFTYGVPDKPEKIPSPQFATELLAGLPFKGKPVDPINVDDALKEFLDKASEAYNAAPMLDKKDMSEATMEIKYGLDGGFNAGIALPISMVVIDANFDYDHNTVQTITLTFAPKTKGDPKPNTIPPK